jgi:16S rRNA C967 or C1407 C5-methylase (RsmB/RsmF family)/NOL1/NOP2/fmu family ribosome biogenesis protein
MNLNPAFVRQMRRLLPGESGAFMRSLEEDLPVSLRLNTAKCSGEKALNCLPANVQSAVPWCPDAYYLEQRPFFTFDPFFHCGLYYVQEASSMFTARAIHAALQAMKMSGRAVRMLDLCAAPGGKSTLAASVLPEGSLLLANEIVPSRAVILEENLVKWGKAEVVVTQNEPADFAAFEYTFDLILADMPCSGEGMFRKEPEALAAWSEDNVLGCALRQRNILAQCWNSLRPGGCLIYSTCTYNTEENEKNVLWAAENLGARVLPVECNPDWNIHPAIEADIPAYRFFPHRTRGEGFFLALLQKEEALAANSGTGAANSLTARANSGTDAVNSLTGVADSQILAANPQTGLENYQQKNFKEPFRPKKGRNKSPSGKKFGKFVNEVMDKKKLSHLNSLFDEPEAYEISLLPWGVYRAFPSQHAAFLARISHSLRIVRAGLYLGEYKGNQFIPDVSLALSTAVEAGKHFPSYELHRQQALAYLKRESLQLSEDCPQGQVLVTYGRVGLGWVNNLGIRANNRYPASWKIRSQLPVNQF